MIRYALRRLLISIPVVIASSIVVFVLVSLSGDPLAAFKGRNPPPSPAVVRVEMHRLHLDQPLVERYWTWVTGLIHGDFGPSVRANVSIGHELATRVLVTGRLIILAVIIAVVLAIAAGVVSAVRQYSGVDYSITFAAFLFLSMPSFWFAILLKEWATKANDGIGHQIFFTIGEGSIIPPAEFWPRMLDIFGHMILPTIALALISFGAWSRFQRTSMLEVLGSDYVRLATAKGLSRRRVMIKHALRTSLGPLTTVVSLDFAALISGAVVTETVFQWHGMGDFIITSLQQRDVFATLAWLLVSAVAVIVFNLIADLLYAALDPRIRYD